LILQDQDGPERILTIAGELEPCLDCLTDALATMAENQKLRQDSSELRALVHTSQAGKTLDLSRLSNCRSLSLS
jgi:hypothetical protein